MSEECECEECEEGVPAWVMTFADLMTLLMCFFVLLLSFSIMDAQKFQRAAGSLRDAFGVQRQIPDGVIPKGTSVIAQEFSPGKPEPTPIKIVQQKTLDSIRENIDRLDTDSEEVKNTVKMLISKLEEEVRDGLLEVEVEEDTLMIRINEQGSFPSGAARLARSFLPVLDKITDLLNSSTGRVMVSGHTDNRPINTTRYPSNWVLSADRAASVVHHLTKHGFAKPERLEIRAFADTRPLFPNDTPANRAKNRRIEINLDTHDYSSGDEGDSTAAAEPGAAGEPQADMAAMEPTKSAGGSKP
jgi:chemotaxis protein MotB